MIKLQSYKVEKQNIQRHYDWSFQSQRQNHDEALSTAYGKDRRVFGFFMARENLAPLGVPFPLDIARPEYLGERDDLSSDVALPSGLGRARPSASVPGLL